MTVDGSHDLDDFRAVEARLVAAFSPPLDADDVRRHVADAVAMFHGARVRTYLAVLIERAATDRLRAACDAASESTPVRAPDARLTSNEEPVPVGGG